MANNDKLSILTDDETDERWRATHNEPVSTHSWNQEPGPSTSAPALDSPSGSQASTSSSKLSMGCMERICLRINPNLLISKIFYFFFYSAYGSLYPLLPVYYKQLGLTASQSGLLVGIRYFIEFCSAPFWGVLADRFRKGKVMLLFSVLCWLVFNLGIGFIKPADISCVEQGPEMGPQNSTQLNTSVFHSRHRRNVAEDFFVVSQYHDNENDYRPQDRYSRSIGAGPAETLPKLDNATTSTASSPTISSTTDTPAKYIISYNKEQVDTIFLIILLIIIIGEFFSAPAVTIVDTVTLQYLGRQRDRYGLQRMWGSLGWGLAMLSVGIWIDHTHIQSYIQGDGCSDTQFKNYQIAFIVFGVLMGIALLVATQFYFDGIDHSFDEMENREQVHIAQRAGSSEEATLPPNSGRQEFRFGDLVSVLCSIQCSTVLFVAWFMGFGYGFVFTFLYWYLQILNGTTTLFGICSVLSHVSELVAYFTSHKLIELVGHIRVLYIGLACNTGRYLYISYLQNAWVVLPMEVLQGLTHALVWAACISYLGTTVPPALRTSAQGTLQGLHLGLGRGCGAMLGGVFVSYFGEAATFRGLGMASLVILIIFAFIQCLTRQGESDEDVLVDSVPVQSTPVPIATIDASPQPPPMKTKHQQEQEDANKAAWVLSASPWVNVAFALCQIQEVIKRAKRNLPAVTLSPQGTDEVASSEPPTEETPKSQPEEQSGISEQQTPTDQATGQPSKELPGQADRPGAPTSSTAVAQAARDPAVENQTALPGNYNTVPQMSPNNPFYQ